MAFTVGSVLLVAHAVASTLFLQTMPTSIPAAPTPPAGDAEVMAHISQLSDPDPAVRDAAHAALTRSDPGVIDLLKSARDKSTDPDLQLHLDSLIVYFSESAAIGGSRITLRFENAPLKEVLDEFARQAKTNFSDPGPEFGNEPPRITIRLDDVSFWTALASLQTAGNLNIFPQPDGWRVMRNFGNPLFGPNAVEAGAFLVQPMSASYQRSVSYARNMGGGGENFSITMQLLTEPKIRLAQATGQFRITEAVDSNGNSLLGPNNANPFVTGVGQSQIHMSTQLAYPKNPGEHITRLSGSIKLNMARRVHAIAVDDFGPTHKPIEETFESAKITISPAEANPGQPNWVNAAIIIDSPNDAALLQRLMNMMHQVRLTDQNGRAFQIANFQQPVSSPQRTEARISFMPMGNVEMSPPYRLTIEIPTSFREVEVPFTLRDLKMP